MPRVTLSNGSILPPFQHLVVWRLDGCAFFSIAGTKGRANLLLSICFPPPYELATHMYCCFSLCEIVVSQYGRRIGCRHHLGMRPPNTITICPHICVTAESE